MLSRTPDLPVLGLGQAVDYSQGLPTPVGDLGQDAFERMTTANAFTVSALIALGYEIAAEFFWNKSESGDRVLAGGMALTHGATTYYSYQLVTDPLVSDLGKIVGYAVGALTAVTVLGSLIVMVSPRRPKALPTTPRLVGKTIQTFRKM